MKVRIVSIYKYCKNLGIWYLLKPKIKKYWMGQMTHIGTRGWYIVIDRRGINSMQDFADALSYPKIWHILKKLKRH